MVEVEYFDRGLVGPAYNKVLRVLRQCGRGVSGRSHAEGTGSNIVGTTNSITERLRPPLPAAPGAFLFGKDRREILDNELLRVDRDMLYEVGKK